MAKGLAKHDEIWEEGLRESLEQKESSIKEIYERLKTSKSKKKRMELKKFCQETLFEGIANPNFAKKHRNKKSLKK